MVYHNWLLFLLLFLESQIIVFRLEALLLTFSINTSDDRKFLNKSTRAHFYFVIKPQRASSIE